MTRARAIWSVLGTAVLLLITAVNTYAAEEGANAAERANEIFKWINFAIVACLVIWVFAKLTPPFFRKNAESISSAITRAAAAKTEADRRLRDAEGKLSRLPQEVAQLRATAEQERSAEAERIRVATHGDIEKIGLAAKAEIEAAERSARLELKTIAANLAVDGAESLLARQLTPQTQEELVSAFVRNLDRRPN
jgi:F-type H+-transporting ATPase subunit b